MDSLSSIAAQVGGTLHGGDASFGGVSTDTRTLVAGDVFFALRGPRFDAAAFAAEAAERGAVGAVVERRMPVPLSQIEVKDSRKALADYAARWRARIGTPVIGITGSNGKTTVKELCAAILRVRWPRGVTDPVLATRGNLNNEIGVPLTLLRLRSDHSVAVVEMGASKPGDIRFLAGLVQPQIAVLTSIGRAHIETMGGLDGVARTKGELLDGLGRGATAVLPADSAYSAQLVERAAPARVLTFGTAAEADVRATHIEATVEAGQHECRFTLRAPELQQDIVLPLAGQHNIGNALAAAAATLALGARAEDVARGLAGARNVEGRLRTVRLACGATLYDDAYNANPDSVAAAIDAMQSLDGRTLLVLGDMGELGEEAAALHAATGRRARDSGAQHLYCTGELSRATAAAFGSGAQWFAETDQLCAAVRAELGPDCNVLVKASRFMALDRVVQQLTTAEGEA